MKKIVLFFISEDWYFWSHRLPIAQAVRNAGFKVLVATRVNELKENIEKEKFKLLPLNLKRRSSNIVNEISSITQIISIYKREKPDIVHHVALKPVIYGTLASMLTGVPNTINALAGLGFVFVAPGWKISLFKWLILSVFKAMFSITNTIVIFQNPEDLFFFTSNRIIKQKQTVLIKGSGVNTAYFSYSHESYDTSTAVVLASRMIWNKGIGEFFKAAKILKKEMIECRLILVGAPDPENPASIPEETLYNWHKSGLIEYWGRQSNMPSVFAQSNIVVLPTYYGEGLPKVLLEAASCGRAIVATNVPGCTEIVRHNENGILIPPRDSRALATAIKCLIENPDLRLKMGKRGREIVVSEFSEEIVVKKTMDLYKKMEYQLKRKKNHDHSCNWR